MSTETRDLASEVLRGSPHGGPQFRIGEWRVTINPHAATIWIKRGPEYQSTLIARPEDTEPVVINGIPYSVSALVTVAKDGTAEIDRISGFRTDKYGDLTRAAVDKSARMVRAIIDQIPDLPGIGEACAWHRAVAKVKGLETKLAELKASLADAEDELAQARTEL
jgi:hypothetical protein